MSPAAAHTAPPGQPTLAFANRHPRLRLNRRTIARAFRLLEAHRSEFALRTSQPPATAPGELSLVFLTDTALAQLHGRFLDDPAPTDVITFEGDAALGSVGEICVSVDAALRHLGAAAKSRRTMAAFSAELTLYVIHGWLHLLGHDDLVPARKRAMRRAEARAMNLLRTQEASGGFSLKPAVRSAR